VVWVLREVQSLSGWVSLVEGKKVFLPVPRASCEESLEGFLVEIRDDGLEDFYSMPFDCGVRVVDPSRFDDLAEFEQKR
jgi:hypothetical protein